MFLLQLINTGEATIDAVLLFLSTSFPLVHVHSFLVAFFGGYDDNTLSELDRATGMATGVKILVRMYYYVARVGARISPFYNKFKNRVYDAAKKEAEELNSLKETIV